MDLQITFGKNNIHLLITPSGQIVFFSMDIYFQIPAPLSRMLVRYFLGDQFCFLKYFKESIVELAVAQIKFR